MIVASTIQLAHALEMRIVAEGVENSADLGALATMGIDMLQGYHLGHPMPASDINAWLIDWASSEHTSMFSSSDEPAQENDTDTPMQDREDSR